MTIHSILFDRDGTLIEDRHYLSDPEGVVLLPSVGPTLRQLSMEQRALYVVSNQSGVGRGLFSSSDVTLCNDRLAELLRAYNVTLADIVYCPHAPEQDCGCRKPASGMWDTLVKNFSCLASQSTVMVGDKVEDIQFAYNAGLAAGILVLTGKGKKTQENLGIPLSGSCSLFLEEMRYGFPRAVIESFADLPKVIEAIESHKCTSSSSHL